MLGHLTWAPAAGGLQRDEAGQRKGGAQKTRGLEAAFPSAAPPDCFFPSPSKLEKRSIFLERAGGLYANSDEEDGYDSPDIKRRGASVDDFLRGSELGKQVSVDGGPHRPLHNQRRPCPWERGGGARPGYGNRSVWEVEI